jgi:hypothetical protein
MRTMDYNRLTKILHSNIDQTGKKETLSFPYSETPAKIQGVTDLGSPEVTITSGQKSDK